jgi:hypothetical protein
MSEDRDWTGTERGNARLTTPPPTQGTLAPADRLARAARRRQSEDNVDQTNVGGKINLWKQNQNQ